MSLITLAQVKADLRVTHNEDDTLLQVLLDASEDEALRFLNASELPLNPDATDAPMPSIYAAVFLLVRAKYEAAEPGTIEGLRKCAETLLMPYREQMGP